MIKLLHLKLVDYKSPDLLRCYTLSSDKLLCTDTDSSI